MSLVAVAVVVAVAFGFSSHERSQVRAAMSRRAALEKPSTELSYLIHDSRLYAVRSQELTNLAQRISPLLMVDVLALLPRCQP